MADKSNFAPEEWKLLLRSVMTAGIAVSMAEPSGLWGLLKEGVASAKALAEAKIDPGADALVKAVVGDFDTATGRSAARATSSCSKSTCATEMSSTTKYATRFQSTRRRVAPENSGNANCVEPNLAIPVFSEPTS